MEHSVPFKFTLMRGDTTTERRRVRLLDPSLSDVHKYARQWAVGDYTLKYMDDESDLVTMDLEEEWVECLTLWNAMQKQSGPALLRLVVEMNPVRGKKRRDIVDVAEPVVDTKCAGCTFSVTGITPTHCCRRCSKHPGQHGPRCLRSVFVDASVQLDAAVAPDVLPERAIEVEVTPVPMPLDEDVPGEYHTATLVSVEEALRTPPRSPRPDVAHTEERGDAECEVSEPAVVHDTVQEAVPVEEGLQVVAVPIAREAEDENPTVAALRDMGFEITSAVRLCVTKHKGNVQRTVEELMNGNKREAAAIDLRRMGYEVTPAVRLCINRHRGDLPVIVEALAKAERVEKAAASLSGMGYEITSRVRACINRHDGDVGAVLNALVKNRQQPARAPVVHNAESAAEELRRMGFDVTPSVIECISRHNGDVAAVLQELM